MTDYDNTNKGVLFKNERKEKDTHPDFTGNATVECTNCGHKNEVSLAAWAKTARDGVKKFLSLSFSEPRPKQDSNSDNLGF